MTDEHGALPTKGILIERFGPWADVRLAERPVPQPGRGELLVAVEAASLNFPDLLMIEGKYQFRPPLPAFAGREAAGRVVAVGEGVSRFAPGDRVAAQARYGAFAERVLVSENRCFALPANIDATLAAAAGTVFATAHVALVMRGGLRRGETVLVTGAAGGVGLATIQLAKLLGARTVALVSSKEKEEAVRRHGADHVVRVDQIENLREDLRNVIKTQGIDGVDVVLDVVGGDSFDATIRCLRPGGRLLVVGFTSGRIPDLKVNYLLLKNIAVIGSPLDAHFEWKTDEIRTAMRTLFEHVAAGRLDPGISATYKLADFHEAARLIADRKVIGKVVLVP